MNIWLPKQPPMLDLVGYHIICFRFGPGRAAPAGAGAVGGIFLAIITKSIYHNSSDRIECDFVNSYEIHGILAARPHFAPSVNITSWLLSTRNGRWCFLKGVADLFPSQFIWILVCTLRRSQILILNPNDQYWGPSVSRVSTLRYHISVDFARATHRPRNFSRLLIRVNRSHWFGVFSGFFDTILWG